MQSFIKLLFGGYGSGNWEYLAQHGGTQFLKRKSAQRPFWLPLLYIAMMGIGFPKNSLQSHDIRARNSSWLRVILI